MNVTFQDVIDSSEIRTYISQADDSLRAMGYTEHSFAHMGKCAQVAARILTGEVDISQLPVEYAPAEKVYNPVICQRLGLTAPQGYTALG